jgi:hypothetical protein
LAEAITQRGVTLSGPITVFGSAPLQIWVDRELLSADVDISVPEKMEMIQSLVEEIGYGKGKADFYIEVVPSYVFRPGANWIQRARIITLSGVQFIIPDTLDILLAKLRRLEDKDMRAFCTVRARTGRPTETEVLNELRAVYDMFYIQMNAEKSVLWQSTERLWTEFFGRHIDVPKEIHAPVFEALELAGYRDRVEELKMRLGVC